jgi:hypothetical protein
MGEVYLNHDVHSKYKKLMFYFEICHLEVVMKQILPPNVEVKQLMLQKSLTENQSNHILEHE